MTAQQNKQPKKVNETTEVVDQKITCGIIMPIATMSPEYTAEHWEDVRTIIDAAIERAGFEPRIVSDSEDSTIIHKSIINNIYHDEIIVCDVSNKNANVMFELGMRLAFNKPVVIIKDDKTGYSFDTSNIEHVGYRKDLRHNTIEKFINDLSKKIRATFEAPKKDDYQPFLSHFGKFEVAKIENKSIEGSEALEKLLEKVTSIDNRISTIESNQGSDRFINITSSPNYSIRMTGRSYVINFSGTKKDVIREIIKEILEIVPLGIDYMFNDNYLKITLKGDLSDFDRVEYEQIIKNTLDKFLNIK